MFDHYEPEPALACPQCGAASLGWQGKDGPCALFLWRQGHRHPVDQRVDDDARVEQDRLREFQLPTAFVIVGRCANDHDVVARGHAPDGVWTMTEGTRLA